STRAIHVGYDNAGHNRSVMPPLYQTSVFAYDHVGEAMPYVYARSGNPTRSALDDCLASLEEARYGLAFSSGMAAIDAVLRACLKPGDEVVAVADLYGGAYRLLSKVMEPAGIKVSFADLSDSRNLTALISAQTKLLWLESPTNPLLGMVDIAALAEIAHAHGARVAVDSTFATPNLQNPLDLGAD
ncbi:cystathionine gamma-synthase, partial [Pseudomonas sp. MWU13-2860]